MSRFPPRLRRRKQDLRGACWVNAWWAAARSRRKVRKPPSSRRWALRKEAAQPLIYFLRHLPAKEPALVHAAVAPQRALFLRSHLVIGIAPRTDLQAAANPTEIFFLTARWPVERRTRCPADRTRLRSHRAFHLHRLFCHFQNLRRDDGLGGQFLFHSCFNYIAFFPVLRAMRGLALKPSLA